MPVTDRFGNPVSIYPERERDPEFLARRLYAMKVTGQGCPDWLPEEPTAKEIEEMTEILAYDDMIRSMDAPFQK
jgi:hypothetical protein